MKSRNIKTTIIKDRYISSAEIETAYPFTDIRFFSYETFVWEYDMEKGRGKLIYQTNQNTYAESLNVHKHFVNNFCKKIIECEDIYI